MQSLTKAEDDVARGSELIRDQRARLIYLERRGDDIQVSSDQLALLEDTQILHMKDRNRLRYRVEQLLAKINERD